MAIDEPIKYQSKHLPPYINEILVQNIVSSGMYDEADATSIVSLQNLFLDMKQEKGSIRTLISIANFIENATFEKSMLFPYLLGLCESSKIITKQQLNILGHFWETAMLKKAMSKSGQNSFEDSQPFSKKVQYIYIMLTDNERIYSFKHYQGFEIVQGKRILIAVSGYKEKQNATVLFSDWFDEGTNPNTL